jgi:hypothetical protein
MPKITCRIAAIGDFSERDVECSLTGLDGARRYFTATPHVSDYIKGKRAGPVSSPARSYILRTGSS